MAQIALANLTMLINNIVIQYTPNSLKFTEGLGEQNYRTQTSGAGRVESVYSENAENKISKIDFSLRNTPDNIALSRGWKNRGNTNTIVLVNEAGDFTRTFKYAALIANYEVEAGADGNVALSFSAEPAI